MPQEVEVTSSKRPFPLLLEPKLTYQKKNILLLILCAKFASYQCILNGFSNENQRSQSALYFSLQMAGFSSLAPKMKNLVVAGSLTGFVFSVYFYTMRAVASGDELQVAIDKFEEQKSKDVSTVPSKV
uniref:Cytochrome c oxidase assembly factor 3 mitochondrial coiled-coil domain-containing protein n=2 Tax=Quercus TaxID=3511 RepID=A0A7N2MT05_QUELO